MSKEPKKAHLNLSINPNLAEIFEDMMSVHGKTFSGFLEEKILELLKDIAPDKLMELEIKATEAKLVELKENLPSVKFAYNQYRKTKQMCNSKAKDDRVNDTKLDEKREALFQRYFDTLKYQVENNRGHDWTKLQDDFGFKNKSETQKYIYEKLVNCGVAVQVVV